MEMEIYTKLTANKMIDNYKLCLLVHLLWMQRKMVRWSRASSIGSRASFARNHAVRDAAVDRHIYAAVGMALRRKGASVAELMGFIREFALSWVLSSSMGL
ncbi:unnamed protein product [Citrullus colocynthis]|uniref:Uncharacterized protein n=1 Tax=Citrullus colocynthis TaxID=252529 RepID=A0ABP0ZBI5_9ROSI